MSRRKRYLRRLEVCLAWASFILSCALWVWAESPRGPSGSVRLSDPDNGMVLKLPTGTEAVQTAKVYREFAEVMRKAETEQAKADEGSRLVPVSLASTTGESHRVKNKSPIVLLVQEKEAK